MRTKIIAEAASNHDGDIEKAVRMVWAAKESGADIIKFQTWQAKDVRPNDPDFQRFNSVELKDEHHRLLVEECKRAGIQYLATCFDFDRIPFLASLGLDTVKVASYDSCSFKTIERLAQYFDHLIISTGGADEQVLKRVANLLQGRKYTLLHCVVIYPTPPELANMTRMDWLRRFSNSVGFSDHTIGTDAAKVAISRGAAYVEKHFTLDKAASGKFHSLAASPEELKEIVRFSSVTNLMDRNDQGFSSEEKETWNKYRCRLGRGL